MSTYETSAEKPTDARSIAREHVADNPVPIGRDAEGTSHFWSRHDRVVVLVDGGDASVCEQVAVETADGDLTVRELRHRKRPLYDWAEYVRRECGWAVCKIVETRNTRRP